MIQPADDSLLFYHGPISDDAVGAVQHLLMRMNLNADQGVPLVLQLSSVAGSPEATLALIATISDIQRSGRRVHVHLQGAAMNLASAVAQIADHRTAEPDAFFLLQENRELARKKAHDAIYRHYAARTGKPLAYYRSKLGNLNWYLSATDALAEGFVDEIATDPNFRALTQRPAKHARPRSVLATASAKPDASAFASICVRKHGTHSA